MSAHLNRKVIAYGLVYTAAQFWFAQLVVWGLSLYRIHSGIWAPWLIMEGTSSLIVGCIRIAILNAAKDVSDG